MRIVPVIDLRGGRAVTGRAGDRERYLPVVSRMRGGAAEDLSDPLRLARALAACLRAARLYVADLDRIEKTGDNGALVAALAGDDPARTILWDGGAAATDGAPPHERITPVLATETLASPGAIDAACAAHDRAAGAAAGRPAGAGVPRPARPWLGLDLEGNGLRARSPEVAALGAGALLRRAAEAGVAGAVVVALDRVGTGAGLPRRHLLDLRAAAPAIEMVAGGGIASIEDLLFLRAAGFQGALVATALHDGRLRPADLRDSGLL